MTVEDTGKVTMYIDSKDNVSVSLELQGEEYGPFRGVFTCEEDLDIQAGHGQYGEYGPTGILTSPCLILRRILKLYKARSGKERLQRRSIIPRAAG